MEKAGAIVSGTVCDGSTTNKSVLDTLGISGDIENLKTSFENPVDVSRNVFTVVDVPHIIKCIRNNLRKACVFMFPGGVISMKHFEVLLKEDSCINLGLRVAPKLTNAHNNPNSFQKMSVCLVTQLMDYF